jgi:hypothetical protein
MNEQADRTLRQLLRNLPERPAPAGLESRVLQQLERRRGHCMVAARIRALAGGRARGLHHDVCRADWRVATRHPVVHVGDRRMAASLRLGAVVGLSRGGGYCFDHRGIDTDRAHPSAKLALRPSSDGRRAIRGPIRTGYRCVPHAVSFATPTPGNSMTMRTLPGLSAVLLLLVAAAGHADIGPSTSADRVF